MEHVLEDERFQTYASRMEARSALISLFSDRISQLTVRDLIDVLEPTSVPYSKIGRPSDMLIDPHVNRPMGLFESKTDEGKLYKAPGLPFEVDGRSIPIKPDLPKLGQHNSILQKVS